MSLVAKKPAVEEKPEPTCNVPSCLAEPQTRGMCEVHWSTHRGLADPQTDEELGELADADPHEEGAKP